MNEHEYGALIIARLSSSRLPKKNIIKILGKPMIQYLYERVSKSKNLSKIIICTSTHPSDDDLEKLCTENKWDIFRGSLEDIMERQIMAAQKFKIKNIVEILGDNPLVHSEIIDDVINIYSNENVDYAGNITKEYSNIENRTLFAIGLRVQVYATKLASMYKSYEVHKDPNLHPSSFIYNNKDFSSAYLEAVGKYNYLNKPDLNFAVNYKKNFILVREIIENLYKEDSNFNLKKVFEYLDNNKYLYSLFGSDEN